MPPFSDAMRIHTHILAEEGKQRRVPFQRAMDSVSVCVTSQCFSVCQCLCDCVKSPSFQGAEALFSSADCTM